MKLKFHIDMVIDFNDKGNKNLKDVLNKLPSKEFKKFAEEQMVEDIQSLFENDNEITKVDVIAKCLIKHK